MLKPYEFPVFSRVYREVQISAEVSSISWEVQSESDGLPRPNDPKGVTSTATQPIPEIFSVINPTACMPANHRYNSHWPFSAEKLPNKLLNAKKNQL
jgi:hypothetical protein